MTTKQALGDISKALGRLRYEIGIENAAGYLSQNKLLENLILPVFQIVFDLPHLRNANDAVSNAAFIDLADDVTGTAFQVTTERGAAKITETLSGFLKAKKQLQYNRLIFFIFASQPANYQKRSIKEWTELCKGKMTFSTQNEVVQFDSLYQKISNLDHSKIVKIRNIIAQSIVGEEYLDVAAAIAGQAQHQVDEEKRSSKYIPDIFVETTSAKSLARQFWHPFLFFEHVLDEVDRTRLPLFNRLLDRCGLTAAPVPIRQRYGYDRTWNGLQQAVNRLRADLLAIEEVTAAYKEAHHGQPPPASSKPERRYYFDQNAYHIRGFANSTKEWIEKIRQELSALSSRVFILTGKAGQGKTNFACDLVENFALRHGIPCAYFTGLQLGRVSADLPDHIKKALFKGALPTFEDAAKAMSDYAASLGMPFVILFEGLNEHARLGQFPGQLEELIKVALRHPAIRIFLTCRSEYFDQRFGNLLRSSFKSDIHMLEAAEQRMDDDQRKRMVDGYFKFFGVDPDLVSEEAEETLRADTLLLRFFCDAYGNRGRPETYNMSEITHIYRAQIFDYYLKTKLRSAADARERSADFVTIRGTEADLLEVIKLIVGHMVMQRNFSDVPLNVIPNEKAANLLVLLNEDIILRRDLANDPSDLGPARDVLNFTYDEFRDFLIAKYLIDNVFTQNQADFLAFMALGENGAAQISEGVKRFLFYWSRQAGNATFRQFYSTQPAYSEVYHEEIFSIDKTQIDSDDEQRVRAILIAEDQPATRTASRLISLWNSKYCPILNLDLLLDVVSEGDDERHDNLIQKNFVTSYARSERESWVEQYCRSFEECILPKMDLSVHQVLFDFLPMLFSIEANAELDSPAVYAFRRFARVAPTACIAALLRSLDYEFTRHRPFVWRLLAELHADLPDRAGLLARAQAELAVATPTTAVEIERFLHRVTTS